MGEKNSYIFLVFSCSVLFVSHSWDLGFYVFVFSCFSFSSSVRGICQRPDGFTHGKLTKMTRDSER